MIDNGEESKEDPLGGARGDGDVALQIRTSRKRTQ
jgi:hypothetical protein